jgi:hypothetical protein
LQVAHGGRTAFETPAGDDAKRTPPAWLRRREAAGVTLGFSHDVEQWVALGEFL